MKEFIFDLYVGDIEAGYVSTEYIKAETLETAIKKIEKIAEQRKLEWEYTPPKHNYGTQRSPFGIGS